MKTCRGERWAHWPNVVLFPILSAGMETSVVLLSKGLDWSLPGCPGHENTPAKESYWMWFCFEPGWLSWLRESRICLGCLRDALQGSGASGDHVASSYSLCCFEVGPAEKRVQGLCTMKRKPEGPVSLMECLSVNYRKRAEMSESIVPCVRVWFCVTLRTTNL